MIPAFAGSKLGRLASLGGGRLTWTLPTRTPYQWIEEVIARSPRMRRYASRLRRAVVSYAAADDHSTRRRAVDIIKRLMARAEARR